MTLGSLDPGSWHLGSRPLDPTTHSVSLRARISPVLSPHLTVTSYALVMALGPVHTSAVLRVRVVDMPGLDEYDDLGI